MIYFCIEHLNKQFMYFTFTRKGYGRIYVDSTDNIKKVKEIIKEIDDYELNYLPDDLIIEYTEYPNVVYVHKFCDMNLYQLTNECWKRGIKIWCLDNGQQEYLNQH